MGLRGALKAEPKGAGWGWASGRDREKVEVRPQTKLLPDVPRLSPVPPVAAGLKMGAPDDVPDDPHDPDAVVAWLVEPSPALHSFFEAQRVGRIPTRTEIGALFGLSMERIRQLENQALAEIGWKLGVDVELDCREDFARGRRSMLTRDAE